MAARKKTFKETISPAMQFITRPEPEEVAPPADRPEAPPEGYKLNPLYIETRSKRLQLLLQPSLYARIKERADLQGQSVNDLIHTILEDATKEESAS